MWYNYYGKQIYETAYNRTEDETTEEILYNRKDEILRAISEACSDDQVLLKACPK